METGLGFALKPGVEAGMGRVMGVHGWGWSLLVAVGGHGILTLLVGSNFCL